MVDSRLWQDLVAEGQAWVRRPESTLGLAERSGFQSNYFEASLRGMTGSRRSSLDSSSRGVSGASTPPPLCIVGALPHGISPLSSGKNTPPERESFQQLMKSMEAPTGCKMPLKPGLVDEPRMPWPLPALAPPGLPPPPPAATFARPVGPASPAPMPTPTSLTSPGSVGHPERCAEACKYVKRKTGCLMGAACPQCHLCFWQRKPVSSPSSKEPESDGISLVADFASGINNSTQALSEKAPLQESVGSRGHPHSCAEGCRYVKRKGGCRNGSACPDCHLCAWRRTPQNTQAEVAGLGEKTVAGFDVNLSKELQSLICMHLERASTPSTDATAATVTTASPASSGLSSPASCGNFEAHDGAVQVRPPPGLELRDSSKFLTTRAPSLPNGKPTAR